MKNIIFLDIDGVLNCELHYHSKFFLEYKEARKKLKKQVKKNEISRLEYYRSNICPDRMNLFNKLCLEVNADVVISSSWRLGNTLEELIELLEYCGATFNIIGKTDFTGYERGTEISKYLKENINEEEHGCLYFDFYRYAIIDDDSDMLLNQQYNFFQTDSYCGLTYNTCDKIRKFFNHKTF